MGNTNEILEICIMCRRYHVLALTKIAMWRSLLPGNELHLDLGKYRDASDVVYAIDDQEML